MQAITPTKPTTAINTVSKLWFVIAGSLLFNFLFWHEKVAINAIFFFFFITVAITYFYPKAWQNKMVKWLLLATIFSLVMVILHNTALSKLAFIAALFLMSAFSQYTHNSLLFASGSGLQTFLFLF